MEGGDSPPQMKAQPPVSFTPADFPAKELAGQLDFNPFSEQAKPQPHTSMRVMYCECFASGVYCDGCNCSNCCNNVENEAAQREAVEATLERNPNAFKPKIASGPGVREISSSAFSSSSSSSSDDDMLPIMGAFLLHQETVKQMMFLVQLREAAKELTPSASRPHVKKRCIKRDRDARGQTTCDPPNLGLGLSKRSNSDAEEAGDVSVGESERPKGRKVMKRRLREKVNNTVVDLITTELKELSSRNSDMSQILKDFVTRRKEYRAHKMMMRAHKMTMREQKLRIYEDRIMLMDTLTMTPEQAACIEQKRAEIMQRVCRS